MSFATQTSKQSRIDAEQRTIRKNKDAELYSDGYLSIISEVPFVIKVNTRGILSKIRSSKRSTKRKHYIEDEPDSDFLDSDTEYGNELRRLERNDTKNKKTKKSHVLSKKQDETIIPDGDLWNEVITGDQIEPPPSDVLQSLWYSRECCIHVWVVEKILGWKKREQVSIERTDQNMYELDHDTCSKIHDTLINAHISDRKKRMEISRISPGTCPMVLKTAAGREEYLAKAEAREKRFQLKPNDENVMEEVLLIKWRGRS
jgi:hypothetical protein